MANTKRRQNYTDRSGNMFMPMSVEGGNWNEHFFTTTKLISMGLILAALVLVIVYLGSIEAKPMGYVIYIGAWFIVSLYVTRFIIFEEKSYYRMYQELREHEISSPALFWDIASIKDTEDGAILTYSDAKIATIVKVERDTITGKPREFKETHYDAISDFYREIMINRYCFIQMNIMEQAGKDPRLNELSKLVYKNDNDNIRKLMELQVGHIKNITRSSLYESDYFLFYTTDVTRIDNIIPDITECMFKLLDGAYISYTFLNAKDVVELVKEVYGVNYFNSTQAALQMFNRRDAVSLNPFNIKGILWDNEELQNLVPMEVNKLRHLTTSVLTEKMESKDMKLKERLYKHTEEPTIGVDFSALTSNNTNQNRTVNRNKPNVNKKNLGENKNNNEDEFIDF